MRIRTRAESLPPATLAAALLTVVTAVWGSTFPLIHSLVADYSPTDFLAVRFAIAAAVMVAAFGGPLRRLTRRDVAVSVLLGGMYGFAQLLQTIGLAHTTAATSGFLTGLYVVFTPILGALIFAERVPRRVWLAVAVAAVGLAAISAQGMRLGLGELLSIGCALAYAAHIITLGRYARVERAVGMSVLQVLVIAAICLIAAAPDGLALPSNGFQWAAVAYTALAAGVLALWAQTWAQSHLSPTRAAIVMTLEPVWAAGFAALVGERLTFTMIVGGALVVAAMYLTELGGRSSGPPLPALHHEP